MRLRSPFLRSLRASFVVALAWSLALPACGGKTPEEIRLGPRELPFRVEHAGITLQAAPITEGRVSSAFFHTDLLRHDVLAIYVRLDNHRSEGRLAVFSEGFELGVGDGSFARILPDDPTGLGRPDLLQKGLNLVAVIGVLTLAPFIIAAIPLILLRNARFAEVRTALPLGRIWSGSVDPGDATGGFVYFPVESDWLDENRRPTLIATVELLDTHEGILLELPLEIAR